MNLENLKDETEHVGSEALWFGEVSAAARKKARDLKQGYEVFQAKAADVARRHYQARGERATVDMVKEMVVLDPVVQKSFESWSQAEYEADLAESAKFTLARKHEHLQHLTGLLTSELGARGQLPDRPRRTPVP